MITAEEARERFKNETYITGLENVLRAVEEACEAYHKVIVNIPTGFIHGDFTCAYHVAKKMERLGYDVVIRHDSENGSSELTVVW